MWVPVEFEKLLPVAEARPLEVAVAAPGDADNVLQALVASGASVTGEDGARAVMAGLVAAKRTRVHALLDCQVYFVFIPSFCLASLRLAAFGLSASYRHVLLTKKTIWTHL